MRNIVILDINTDIPDSAEKKEEILFMLMDPINAAKNINSIHIIPIDKKVYIQYL